MEVKNDVCISECSINTFPYLKGVVRFSMLCAL